jgi:hypothetical protein
MAARPKAPKLIRYVSPFGSPAWMTREQAQPHLDADDARFVWLQEVERETGCKVLSEHERQIGAPRMEHLG